MKSRIKDKIKAKKNKILIASFILMLIASMAVATIVAVVLFSRAGAF